MTDSTDFIETSDHTLVELRDGLVVCTLNRPEKRNAIGSKIWADLDKVVSEVAADPACRALLLTGAGGTFSSGADLSPGDDGKQGDAGGLTGRGRQPVLHEMRIVGSIISRLHHLPKPTIAAVDGHAYGVALGLAMACDLVLVSERAKLCQVFAERGMALDGGTSWTMPKMVGTRRAKQLAYFAEVIDAERAVEWGLANEVVPHEQLLDTALEWGLRLAKGPTVALGLIKRQIDGSTSTSFDEALEGEARAQHISYSTKDIREGIMAFLEKRDPQFKGY